MTIDSLLLSICILTFAVGHTHCVSTLEAKCLAPFPASKRHSPIEKEVMEIKYSTHSQQIMYRVQRRKEWILRVRRVKKGCPEMVTLEKGVET